MYNLNETSVDFWNVSNPNSNSKPGSSTVIRGPYRYPKPVAYNKPEGRSAEIHRIIDIYESKGKDSPILLGASRGPVETIYSKMAKAHFHEQSQELRKQDRYNNIENYNAYIANQTNPDMRAPYVNYAHTLNFGKAQTPTKVELQQLAQIYAEGPLSSKKVGSGDSGVGSSIVR